MLDLEQTDQDYAFIKFNGTSAADFSKNISTEQGNGIPVGPFSPIGSGVRGWAWAGMSRNYYAGIGEVWIPGFTAVTNP